MKKTKVIIPALGLLLLSTAASVTGTVAWFAANTSVTATGMTVTAKSDSTFLLIKAGTATAAEIQTAKKISDTASNASAQLLPCAHEVAATNISTIEAVADSKYTNWYTDVSSDPSSPAGSGVHTKIASDALANYVLVNEFSLTVAVGSNQMDNLKVGTCTITSTDSQAVKALVATGTASQEFSGTGGSGSTTLQSSLTSTTVMTVRIYIYWDGEDEDVYSNNFAHLQSTTVEVTFTGTVHAA